MAFPATVTFCPPARLPSSAVTMDSRESLQMNGSHAPPQCGDGAQLRNVVVVCPSDWIPKCHWRDGSNDSNSKIKCKLAKQTHTPILRQRKRGLEVKGLHLFTNHLFAQFRQFYKQNSHTQSHCRHPMGTGENTRRAVFSGPGALAMTTSLIQYPSEGLA